jgi:hypothetical protein
VVEEQCDLSEAQWMAVERPIERSRPPRDRPLAHRRRGR